MNSLAEIQDFVYRKCGSPVKFTHIRQVKRAETELGIKEITSPHGEFNEPIEIGLAHVLNASRSIKKPVYSIDAIDIHGFFMFHDGCHEYMGLNNEISWKMLRSDGEQALFKDQSPETQIAIAKLLGWEG